MPTRSLLYHAFGVGTMECTRSEFCGGETVFHIERSSDRWCCSQCHSSNVSSRGVVTRRLRTLPIGQRPSWLSVRIRRLQCHACGALRQEHLPFAEAHKRYTRAFARYVYELSGLGTVRAVARHLGVSWGLVRQIQEQFLRRELAGIKLTGLRLLAIDELAVGKGHDYVTVVLDLESGAAVFVGDGKSAEAVAPFFRRLKHAHCALQAVATDMASAYHSAVQQAFPNIDLVLDRFHVMQLMNQKLSDFRRQLYTRARTLEKRNVLKGTRWLLLKRPENLKPDGKEKERLEQALAINQPLAVAYYLKEDLCQLWQQPTEQHAQKFLDDWIVRAHASGILQLATMARALDRHRRSLLNYYKYPISTGPLEGFNNKAQTMKRQAYGYRNREFLKLKLLTLHTKKYALVG